MSLCQVLDLLDGKTKAKVKNLVKVDDDARILIDDSGIYLYNATTLVIKLSINYIKNRRCC